MRILFVSKPIAPPFHDGAKCLVRDVACNLSAEVRATVLTTRDAPPLGARVNEERLYPAVGSFAPRSADNALVLGRLLFGDKHDLWHFAFAPNPASSTAARLALGARRVPSVQTVASVPRSFEGVSKLLFGTSVVCLSDATRDRLIEAGVSPARCEVIPPPVPLLRPISEDDRRAALTQARLSGDAPILLYPGDLEFSSGARTVADAVEEILRGAPGARIVFACRAKTPKAAEVAAQLKARLARFGASVAFVGEVASLPPLLAASTMVLFPVDDLYGKVDLPIALLEAMALGVPVVALGKGPLRELTGASLIDEPSQLADVALSLLRDERAAKQVSEAQQRTIASRHQPTQIAAAYEAIYRKLLRL